MERLRQRFPWLAEYFRWDGGRIAYAFSPLRPALRMAQQKAQFSGRLPGHVLEVQMGRWWEVWGGHSAYPLPEERRRFHTNRLPATRDVLWESGVPVAWIVETGRRVTGIGERVLVCRWPGVTELGLLEGRAATSH